MIPPEPWLRVFGLEDYMTLRNIGRVALLGTILAGAAMCQEPQLISGLAAMNAASFMPAGLPHEGVAQGARFVVLGKDLAEPVTARIEIDGAGFDAEVKAVSGESIEMMAPRFLPVGKGTVIVTVAGKELRAPITVVESAPGIRTHGAMGMGEAFAIDAGAEPITQKAPAVVGDLVRVRTTGIGAKIDLARVEVLLAGQSLPAAGVTTYPDGNDDIEFTLPEVPAGCYVPLAIKVGSFLSNYATLPVGSRGTQCPDPSRPENYEQLLQEGARVGSISLGRSEVSLQQFKIQADNGSASFLRFEPESVKEGLAEGTAQHVGSCTLLRAIEQDVETTPSTGLDAGPTLVVTGTGGAKEMAGESIGAYTGRFGQRSLIDLPGAPPIPGGLYFEPGTYTVTGNGGEDVGPFSVQVTIPEALPWKNADTFGTGCGDYRCLDRSKELRIEWQPGDAGRLVTVTAISVSDTRPAAAAVLTCQETADKGSLVVPSVLLSALPVSPAKEPQSFLVFNVSNGQTDNRFTADGLDWGHVEYSDSTIRPVLFR